MAERRANRNYIRHLETIEELLENGTGGSGIESVDASIADNEPGTPSVEATLLNKILTLVFHHLKGVNGDTGATPNITIGTVSTGAPGSQADASMTGTPEDPVLNLTIPQGAQGVGFATVSSQEDGTIMVALTNGDSITIDLNHVHSQYPKYVLCESEQAYEALEYKDPETLYLIPETE